jgi:hypothetical protein
MVRGRTGVRRDRRVEPAIAAQEPSGATKEGPYGFRAMLPRPAHPLPRRLRGGSFGVGSASHSSGARSTICGPFGGLPGASQCRAAVSSQPRDNGKITMAPNRPVIKPGITMRIPPSAVADPVPSMVMPETLVLPAAVRNRVTAPMPARRSTRSPPHDTKMSSMSAVANPSRPATTRNATSSANGSASNPKAIILSGCIGPNSPGCRREGDRRVRFSARISLIVTPHYGDIVLA